MKTSIAQFTIAAAVVFAFASTAPEAKCADVAFQGFGSYDVRSSERFFSRPPRQGGRFRSLGADFYRRAEIEVDAVRNFSRGRSGNMSFELWAMPFFGASRGSVLMTNGLRPLNGRRSFRGVFATGFAVSLNQPGFAELSLWEFNRRRWRFRDALSFTNRDWF